MHVLESGWIITAVIKLSLNFIFKYFAVPWAVIASPSDVGRQIEVQKRREMEI